MSAAWRSCSSAMPSTCISLAERTGKHISLALEPEPCCFLETIDEAIDFFNPHLLGRAAIENFRNLTAVSVREAREALRGHLGICLDVCHASVEFEDPVECMGRLAAVGIAVPKIQLSSALRIPAVEAKSIDLLSPFDDGIYLHQTVENNAGTLTRYADLPQAFAALRGGSAGGGMACALPCAAVPAGLRRTAVDPGTAHQPARRVPAPCLGAASGGRDLYVERAAGRDARRQCVQRHRAGAEMGSLATRRVSLWRTALKLGRVSNLPTIWSNVIAGSALAGDAALQSIIAVGVAISAMYIAGMFLNDAFDRHIDARQRPERPIPADDIGADTVFAIGLSLLVVGIVGLAAFNSRSISGLVLAAAILLYDWRHKSNPVAPFIMGSCRALVYVAAALAAGGFLSQTVLVPAAALLAYVAGVTYTARLESIDQIGSLWPLLLLSAPLAVGLYGTDYSLAAIIALLALLACAVQVGRLLRRRAGGDISNAVGLLLAAISLNDALISSTTAVNYAPFACLGCFALTLVLQRYVPAS